MAHRSRKHRKHSRKARRGGRRTRRGGKMNTPSSGLSVSYGATDATQTV